MTPLEAREAHYVKHFGPLTEDVAHPIDAIEPHVDVYQFPPYGERDMWTLVTGGMSDLAQNVPDDEEEWVSKRTEIFMYVEEPKDWMLDILKGLGEMPFHDFTFLHWYHSIPNGMPMTEEPSLLTNFLFLPPYCEEEDFNEFFLHDEKVDFLWLFPITDGELAYKMEHGADALFERFEEAGLSLAVDEQRKSVV